MVVEARELNEEKLFKITKLNLKWKAQHWYHQLDPTPHDWVMLQALLHQKYGNYDEDKLRLKMDVVR